MEEKSMKVKAEEWIFLDTRKVKKVHRKKKAIYR